MNMEVVLVEEMKVLCSFPGITWRNRMKNESVKKTLGTARFDEIVVELRVRWHGHIRRRQGKMK